MCGGCGLFCREYLGRSVGDRVTQRWARRKGSEGLQKRAERI